MAYIAAAAAVVQGAVSLFSAFSGSSAAERAAKQQAKAVMRAEAVRSEQIRARASHNDQESQFQAMQTKQQTLFAMGSRETASLDMKSAQRAALAANGLNVGYGTAGALQMQENRNLERDRAVLQLDLTQKLDHIRRANRYQQEAAVSDQKYSYLAAQSQIQAIHSAGDSQSSASLINGVSGAIGSFANAATSIWPKN